MRTTRYQGIKNHDLSTSIGTCTKYYAAPIISVIVIIKPIKRRRSRVTNSAHNTCIIRNEGIHRLFLQGMSALYLSSFVIRRAGSGTPSLSYISDVVVNHLRSSILKSS